MKDIMLNIESWDNVAAEVKTLIKMEDVFTKANNLLKTIDGYICSYDTNRSIAFSPKDNSALIDTTFSHLDSIKSFSSDGAAYVTDAFLVDFLNRLDAFIGTMQNLTPGNISVSSAPMQRPDGYSIPSQITMSELFGHGNVFDHMLYEEYQEYQMYLKNRGLDSVFSHYDKDGNPIYNDLDGISFEDFRSYLSYGRQIDYKSTKYYTTDEEWRRRVDFWVNVGIGVGILVATAVISCVGTPAAGAAFAGWAGSIYGLFQIGQGISGVSWITGRELDTGERIAFVVFGTLDMIPGIIALRNAYRLSLTGMQFTDETIEALEQMARTGDNAAAYMLKQLADNGNVAAIKAYDALMKEAVDSVTGWSDAGLTPSKIREILDTPKGSRPDPATYLTKEYIDAHLAKFDDGAVKFAWGINPKYNGTVGSPGGQFVMPKSVADDLIKKANGDISMLEKLLGLNPGDLGTSPIRIDIDASNLKGLRMPSGNEVGANKLWMPGGYTDGLLPEAVIDPLNIGEYTYSPIF